LLEVLKILLEANSLLFKFLDVVQALLKTLAWAYDSTLDVLSEFFIIVPANDALHVPKVLFGINEQLNL